MKTKIYLIALLAAFTIASCSKDETAGPAGGGSSAADSLLFSFKMTSQTVTVSEMLFVKGSDGKLKNIDIVDHYTPENNDVIKVTYNTANDRIVRLDYERGRKTVLFKYTTIGSVKRLTSATVVDTADDHRYEYELAYNGAGFVQTFRSYFDAIDSSSLDDVYLNTFTRDGNNNITSYVSNHVGWSSSTYSGATYDAKTNPFATNAELMPLMLDRVLPNLWSLNNLYYFSAGNPLSIPGGNLSPAQTFSYEYDSSNRPSKVTEDPASMFPSVWIISWY